MKVRSTVKRLAAIFLLALGATASSAQTSVRQSGNITPGHAVKWISPGVIGDAGTATAGALSTLGVTNSGGPGFCVNSAAITAPYNQMCFTVTTNGGTKISSYTYNGAISPGFTFDINGVTQGFLAASGSITNNDLACFDGTTGTIKDCGIPNPVATPLSVPRGGTGNTTLTNHGVLLGQGTSAIAATAPSTAGVAFVSNGASADPSFNAAYGLRERLTAARDYFVRTDGNDNNTGLVNSAGGAFLTPQRCLNIVSQTLDVAGQTVQCRIQGNGSGSYSGNIVQPQWIGYAGSGFNQFTVIGENGTVTLTSASATPVIFGTQTGAPIRWRNVTITNPTASGILVESDDNGFVVLDTVTLGATGAGGIQLASLLNGSRILLMAGTITVSGDSGTGFYVRNGAEIVNQPGTTLALGSGRVYTNALVDAAQLSQIQNTGLTVTGTLGSSSVPYRLDYSTFGNIDDVSIFSGISGAGSAVATPHPVGKGGTGLIGGTSGGVPYFNAATTMASSGALASSGIVYGGGAGAAPAADRCTMDSNQSISCATNVTFGPVLSLTNLTADSTASQFLFNKSRTGGNTSTSDRLALFFFKGFANAAYQDSAAITVTQIASSSGSNIPSSIALATSNTAGQLNQNITFDNLAHLNVTGTVPPTNSACTGFAVTGNDTHGRITYNSATTCTINFGTAYAAAPHCVISPGSAASTHFITTSTTQLAVTFGTAQTAFFYHCFGG